MLVITTTFVAPILLNWHIYNYNNFNTLLLAQQMLLLMIAAHGTMGRQQIDNIIYKITKRHEWRSEAKRQKCVIQELFVQMETQPNPSETHFN